MATRISRSFEGLRRGALKALELAERDREVLEQRLPPGAIEGLRLDLEQMGLLVPKVKQVGGETVALTGRQNQQLAAAYKLVSAVRTAARQGGLPAPIRKTYGVGRRTDPRSVRALKAALGQIIAAAEENVDEARSIGLLPSDIEAMRQALSAVSSADDVQESALASAPLTTKARNSAARRVRNATARIASAGILQFAADATRRREFEALL